MKLSEYLLRLALDNNELAKFKRSKQAAEDAMTAAGLTKAQSDLLLEGSADAISQAVAAEIHPSTSPGAFDVLLTMSVCRTW